jgi:hypothetical protein
MAFKGGESTLRYGRPRRPWPVPVVSRDQLVERNGGHRAELPGFAYLHGVPLIGERGASWLRS